MSASIGVCSMGDMGPVVESSQIARSKLLPLKPEVAPLAGRFVALRPYDAITDGEALGHVLCGEAVYGHPAYEARDLVWKYMRGYKAGSDCSPGTIATHLNAVRDGHDSRLFTVFLTATGDPIGVTALLANRPSDLVVEIGAICFTPAYQGTPANTEATFLLLRWAFETGYRRVEWKCNELNVRSKAAALRIGFTFEGIFRQHMIVAGCHSRDTAWLSLLDGEWPAVQAALEAWIASEEPTALYKRRADKLAVNTAPET